jgi:2-iminobutanoate/2-iminopropanoate deaminase
MAMKSLKTGRGAGRLSFTIGTVLAALGTLAMAGSPAQAQVDRVKGNPNALILDGVRVGADVETFYLSGQLPSPVDPKKPMAEVKSVEDMGDTKTQTISTLNKIKSLLEAQGYTMADLVKLSLFVAADPKTGKMDFAGVNEGFRQFFGTAENPNTVARSTFQVAGLVAPYYLIEIEAIAVKKKVPLSFNYRAIVTPDADAQADAGEAGSVDAKEPATAGRLPQSAPAVRVKRPSLVHYTDGHSRRG